MNQAMSTELTINRSDICSWTGGRVNSLTETQECVAACKANGRPLGLIQHLCNQAPILRNAPKECMQEFKGDGWRQLETTPRWWTVAYRLHPDVTVVDDTVQREIHTNTCVIPANPTDDEKRGFIAMVIKRHRVRNVGTVPLDTMYEMMVKVAQGVNVDDTAEDGEYEFVGLHVDGGIGWVFFNGIVSRPVTAAPALPGYICTEVEDAKGQRAFVPFWAGPYFWGWGQPTVESVKQRSDSARVYFSLPVHPTRVVFRKGTDDAI